MTFARSLVGWWKHAGPLRCPRCLADFSEEHALWVSDHPGLQRDNILGSGASARFQRAALRLSARNELVDPMGTPVRRRACPTCREMLAPELIDRRCRVVSVIGPAQSGKSTLLASMLHAARPGLEAAGIGLNPIGDFKDTAWTLASGLFDAGADPRTIVEIPSGPSGPLLISFGRGGDRGAVAFQEIDTGAGAPALRRLAHSDAVILAVDPLRNLPVREAVGHHLQTLGVDPGDWDRALRPETADGHTGSGVSEAISEIRTRRGRPFAAWPLPPVAACLTKLDVWEGLLERLPEPRAVSAPTPSWLVRVRHAMIEALFGAAALNTRDRDLAVAFTPRLVSQIEQNFPVREYFSVQALGAAAKSESSPSGRSRTVVRPVDLRPRGAERVLYWLLANLFPSFGRDLQACKESHDERPEAL